MQKKYAPTAEEAQALAERNITLDDARNLLKNYYDYETILAQSDEQLAEDIEAYYQFTIDNINEMVKYEDTANTLALVPSTNPDENYYIAVDFPGYGLDWFHNSQGQIMQLIEQSRLLPRKLHTIAYIILLKVI